MVITALARNPSLMVVQRERLREVLNEQVLQLSGGVPDGEAVRVGRLVGATILILGSVTDLGNRIRADAQLVSVERGAVLATATAEGPGDRASDVAARFVDRVQALFPRSARTVARRAESTDWQSARANETGERLARQGDLFKAMEEFERALAIDQRAPSARSNYARALQRLDQSALTGSAPFDARSGRTLARRLSERLAGGIELTVGPVGLDGGDGDSPTLRVPVSFRVSPSAVEALVTSFQALGAATSRPSEDTLIIDFPHARAPFSDLSTELMRLRRFYVRVLSPVGAAIAVYSDACRWRWSQWVTVTDTGLRLFLGPLRSEAVFPNLTEEQRRQIASIGLMVESVPRERILVRVDVVDPDETGRRETSAGSTPADHAIHDGKRSDLWREAVAHAWCPPIAERSWGPGHLPTNERSAVLTTLVTENGLLAGPLRVVRSSGDSLFDRSAEEALRTGLNGSTPSPSAAAGGDPADPRSLSAAGVSVFKLRVQFQLRMDLPAMNLIGPLEGMKTVVPMP